jgi:hypothetical protein
LATTQHPSIAITAHVNLVAVSTASTRVTIPTTGTPQFIVVTNLGAEVAFLVLGDNTVVASTSTGFPVLPGTQVHISVGTATSVAAITSTGTVLLRISGGV